MGEVMSQCYEKLPHSCGSADGLQVFIQEDGTVDGHCFACNTHVYDPYGDGRGAKDLPPVKIKSPKEIKEDLKVIASCPSLALPNRKLSEEAMSFFKVKIGMDQRDGKTPNVSHFPYTIDGKLEGFKAKTINLKKNKMWTIGNVRDVDLFGWPQAVAMGAKKLIITEGEYDAIAVKQIIDRHQPEDRKELTPAVTSIPHGAGSAYRDLLRLKDKILGAFRQEDIIFCFDDDEPGHEATRKCIELFPDAKSARLPYKDANECILKGASKAAFKALLFLSEAPKKSRLVSADSLFDEGAKPAEWGEMSWPWDHVNNTTRGIRWGETTYIGAGVKLGKSALADNMAAHFIDQGYKVLMAKPEENNTKTMKNVAGVMAGKVFTDPKVPFDIDAYNKVTRERLSGGKLQLLDIYQHLGWQTLKIDIEDAVRRLDCKVVFIDPITNLTNGKESGDANTLLQSIAQDLSAMAMDLDIHIFIFCHLKAHEGNITKDKREKMYSEGHTIGLGNCPHEQGGDVISSQFAGSRAMMRSCNYMFGLEGNKDDDLPDDVKNMRQLKLLEDREFGETGKFKLYFQTETKRYKEA